LLSSEKTAQDRRTDGRTRRVTQPKGLPNYKGIKITGRPTTITGNKCAPLCTTNVLNRFYDNS